MVVTGLVRAGWRSRTARRSGIRVSVVVAAYKSVADDYTLVA